MPKPVKTIDIDRGQKAIERNIKDMKRNPYVAVGILQKDGTQEHPSGGASVAQVATYQEFGAPKANIPERSFIRSTMSEKRRFFDSIGRQLLNKISQGKLGVFDALQRMGTAIQAEVKDKIVKLNSPPNAPSTIRKKGSDNPLIDTGHMLNSVNYEVVKNGKAKRKSA